MTVLSSLAILLLTPALALASEADLAIPQLSQTQNSILVAGIIVCVLGMFFGFYQF